MGTTSDLKRRNVSDVLRVVQQSGAISKNRIAERLTLSPVTVHNLVNELAEQGICRQTGAIARTGGRSAQLYQINGDYGVVLGQMITRKAILTTLYDLSLRRRYQVSVAADIEDPASFLRAMCDQLARARAQFPALHFLGIGISLPGRSHEGVVLQIPDVKTWRYIPLGEIVEQALGLPVCIDNDTNAMALSARLNGLSSRFNNAVYLHVGEGIGAGILFGDQLFRGSFGYGSEIGHTTVMLDGPRCRCGNRGCLQAFLDGGEILAQIAVRCAERGWVEPTSIADAIALTSQTGDALLLDAFRAACRYVALAIKNIIRNFDPQAVILRCDWLAAFPGLFEQVHETVFADFSWLRQDRFSLLLDEDPDILDAAAGCLFIDDFYAKGRFAGG